MISLEEAINRLTNKFSGKIEYISGWVKFQDRALFFCHERDPITDIEHGFFEKSFEDLLNSSGCDECRYLNKYPWKLTFFSLLKSLYPGQDFKFISSDKNFPRGDDKLTFKCNCCGSIFVTTYYSIIRRKETETDHLKPLVFCPRCSKSRPNKWTEENCLKEAKKYSNLADFRDNSYGAYQAADKNGWLDSYREFLDIGVTRYNKDLDLPKWSIYEYNFYEFNGEPITYVGLTNNVISRKRQHRYGSRSNGTLRYSAVKKYCDSIGIVLEEIEDKIFFILESNLDAYTATVREDYWKNHRIEEGYRVLNVAPTGPGHSSLGGSTRIWTIDESIRAAKEYKDLGKTYKEFCNDCQRAVLMLKENNLLDIYWPDRRKRYTKESFEEACLNCRKFFDKKKYKSLMTCAKDNNDFEKIFVDIFKDTYIPKNTTVIQFSKDRTSVLGIYSSTSAAAKAMKNTKESYSHIKKLCTGKIKKIIDYFWETEDSWLYGHSEFDLPQLIKLDLELANKLYNEYLEIKNELL